MDAFHVSVQMSVYFHSLPKSLVCFPPTEILLSVLFLLSEDEW